MREGRNRLHIENLQRGVVYAHEAGVGGQGDNPLVDGVEHIAHFVALAREFPDSLVQIRGEAVEGLHQFGEFGHA